MVLNMRIAEEDIFGLVASVLTKNAAKGMRFANTLDAGSVCRAIHGILSPVYLIQRNIFKEGR